MKIFKRFKDGFFNPGEVNNYVTDKKFITIIFFFLLVILLSVPQIIYISTTPLLTYEDKIDIRESFYHDGEEIPFKIMAGVLFNKNGDNEYVYTKEIGYNLRVVIKANSENTIYLKDTMVIELNRTGVFLHSYGFKKLLFSYNEYEEIAHLDLKAAYENDSSFWNKVFMIAENEIKKIDTGVKVNNILISVLASAFSLFILSLILTIFNKSSNRRRLSFGKMWQMVIYFLSPYVLVSIISETLSMPFVKYLGILITIINIMRFNQGIIFRGDENEL